MISRNRRVVLGVRLVVEQRFDVAADRRQRRAQLVRDVGDEVAADLIGAPQVGDVVQHQHRAAAAAARDTGAARATNVRPGSRDQRQLAAVDAARRAARSASCAAMSGWRITSR